VQKLVNPQSNDEERSTQEKDVVTTGVVQKVLLVEDHRVDQMVISAMLKKLGCHVHIAPTGMEAVEIIEKERFDLVLMDYDMKEQASILATQKIREYERMTHSLRHLPIVAVTSTYSEGDQENYLSVGMDDHITKPIRYDDLEARLRRWLNQE